MPQSRDSWVFALALLAAAAVLVSIAAAETLLAAACLAIILRRPQRLVCPTYVVPLCAFMAATAASLLMSPEPHAGMASIRKFVLFTMGLLAANLVTTAQRARISFSVLLAVAAITSGYGLAQFAAAYARYLSTGALADDPTVLARITGFMGHWMTFSGEQLLVWCAAVPAMLVLRKRWMAALTVIGAALVLSFTRSVWLGGAAGFAAAALLMPRKLAFGIALPVGIVAAVASGLIVHRLAFSFQQQKFAPDSGRVELFFGGIRMIKDHPLFGVGPERIHTEFPRYYRGTDLASKNFYYGHLENNIVQLAAERGLICLAAFLWFVLEVYSSLIGMLRTHSPETRWIALSAIAALTGFLVSGFFSYNFGDSEVLLLLLFIISIPYGVNSSVRVENACPTNLIPIRT